MTTNTATLRGVLSGGGGNTLSLPSIQTSCDIIEEYFQQYQIEFDLVRFVTNPQLASLSGLINRLLDTVAPAFDDIRLDHRNMQKFVSNFNQIFVHFQLEHYVHQLNGGCIGGGGINNNHTRICSTQSIFTKNFLINLPFNVKQQGDHLCILMAALATLVQYRFMSLSVVTQSTILSSSPSMSSTTRSPSSHQQQQRNRHEQLVQELKQKKQRLTQLEQELSEEKERLRKEKLNFETLSHQYCSEQRKFKLKNSSITTTTNLRLKSIPRQKLNTLLGNKSTIKELQQELNKVNDHLRTHVTNDRLNTATQQTFTEEQKSVEKLKDRLAKLMSTDGKKVG